MEVITRGKADYGVLPIENSTAGIVHEVFDLLVDYDAYIVGEVVIPINHCLLASDEIKKKILKEYIHIHSLFCRVRNF